MLIIVEAVMSRIERTLINEGYTIKCIFDFGTTKEKVYQKGRQKLHLMFKGDRIAYKIFESGY